MSYLRLMWVGIWRRPVRAVLMLLQIVIAFALFGALQGVNIGIKRSIAQTHADRLYVTSRVGAGDLLPLALLDELRAMPNVADITWRQNLASTYQNPQQVVPIAGVDVESFFRVYEELQPGEGALSALRAAPTGAIVGEALAKEHGWKIGQRVPLKSLAMRTDGSQVWAFDIVGFYRKPSDPDGANLLIANYDLISTNRTDSRKMVGLFVMRLSDAGLSAQAAHRIDSVTANSPYATRTQSESQVAQSQIQRLGELDFIANVVTGAALAALLIATTALGIQSIRERFRELAMLKAIGYSDRFCTSLICSESLLVYVPGAVVGLAVAVLLLPTAQRYIGSGSIPLLVSALAIGCAAALALLCAVIPAWELQRLRVAEALSRS